MKPAVKFIAVLGMIAAMIAAWAFAVLTDG